MCVCVRLPLHALVFFLLLYWRGHHIWHHNVLPTLVGLLSVPFPSLSLRLKWDLAQVAAGSSGFHHDQAL